MKVIMRPATKLPEIIIHRKVAAYCWVSTQQKIQHQSLEARYDARTSVNRKSKSYCDQKNRRKSSSLTGCGFLLWTLPRAKNSPPDCFCTSLRTGAALLSPSV